MPVKFVGVALLGGIAAIFALTEFPALTSRRDASPAFLGRRPRAPFGGPCLSSRATTFGAINGRGRFNTPVLIPTCTRRTILAWSQCALIFPNWHQINHRDFRAIYPPGAELLFAGINRISDSARCFTRSSSLRPIWARSPSFRFCSRSRALRQCRLVRLESAGRLQLCRRGSFRQSDDSADDGRRSFS